MKSATSPCTHQWSTWNSQPDSHTQVRWCHQCNATEERPTARTYQELTDIICPPRIKTLPPCPNPSCRAKAGHPCTNSNDEPAYSRIHANRATA